MARGLAVERASGATSGAAANRLSLQALGDVRRALPLAAIAAGEDTSWQALEATLSETNRVPLPRLVRALTAQCASAAGDG